MPGWTFSPVPEVEKAIEDIRRRHPASYPADLDRQRHFLAKLGNPHHELPLVFHVAGTNGKGSTLAFLQAVFETAGLNVHKYTSPHLVRFEERIVIAGKMIAPDLLLEMIQECAQAAEGEKISFFEFFTAMAFLVFSRHPADAVLLETGLGGLYDATNVVEGDRLLSLLTRISYDHVHILGNTLPEIAAHKAGIIKPYCPCIVAPQAPEAADVFAKRAAEMEAPACLYGRDWEVTSNSAGFEYRSAGRKFKLPWPSLQGQHQIYNAGLALAALENSPYAHLLDQKILEQAMLRVNWPGRLQKVTTGPLVELLPSGWELWLDGAHNDSGAEALADQAKIWGNSLPLHLVTAMKRTKDVSGFYRHLLPHASTVQAVDAGWIDAPMTAAEVLRDQIRHMGYERVTLAANLESALRSLTFQFQTPQRILVTGSLYLVGYALQG